MAFQPQSGLPGIGTSAFATPRDVYYRTPNTDMLPLPCLIDGTKVYNGANLPYPWLMFAGTFIGRITASGLYGQSIIGQLAVSYASGTSLTLSAGDAAALNYIQGGSGTFKLTGPPTAGGTVATNTVTYSAINLATGVVTVSSIGTAFVAGSIIRPTNGAENIVSVAAEMYGTKTTDWTNINTVSGMIEGGVYCGGILNSAILVNYSTEVSTRAFIKAQIRANGIPGAIFSDDFGF